MADSTAFPTQHESNDTGYKRISSFAIAGLVIGALFVTFLLLQIAMGFSSRATVLMPLWLEFLPVMGVVLSFVGLRSIRNSDGTLAGKRLATIGIWLSLIAGLGYASYYGATYLAVRQQADAAVQIWADKVRQGKMNEAFLLTQQPGAMRKVNPEDDREMDVRFNAPTKGPAGTPPKPGALDMFRDNELLYMLRQGGKETKIVPLGVRAWDENTGSHTIKRVYGVETPEGSFSLQIVAQGMEDLNAPDKGRVWKVGFMESSVEKDSLKKTALGARLDGLRSQALTFVNDWKKLMSKSDLRAAYAMTLDPKERKAVAATLNDKKAPPPPGYDAAYDKGGLFDFSNLKSRLPPGGKEAAEKALRNYLATNVSGDVVLTFNSSLMSAKKLWSVDAEKRVLMPVESALALGPPGGPPKYAVDLILWLLSEPGALESSGNAEWRLSKIECLKVKSIAEMEPAPPPSASSRFAPPQ